MRICIIGSSGGSVAKELIEASNGNHKFSIITDRECGLESVALESGIDCSRIEEPDNSVFSQKAKHKLDNQGGVDIILLFFMRLVTKELFHTYKTLNFHPSLLPEYRGFNAIERAYRNRVNEFGATLHLVDEKADNGPIIANVSTPLLPWFDLNRMHKISFAQKVYLALHLIDRLELHGNTDWIPAEENQTFHANPSLTSERIRDFYLKFIKREKIFAAT